MFYKILLFPASEPDSLDESPLSVPEDEPSEEEPVSPSSSDPDPELEPDEEPDDEEPSSSSDEEDPEVELPSFSSSSSSPSDDEDEIAFSDGSFFILASLITCGSILTGSAGFGGTGTDGGGGGGVTLFLTGKVLNNSLSVLSVLTFFGMVGDLDFFFEDLCL